MLQFLGVDVLQGIEPITVVYLSFSIVYLLNMIGGVLINCQIDKTEKFELRKLLISFEKVLFCALTMFGLVCATNMMAQGLFQIEKELETVITSIISIGAFALIFAKGFLQKTYDLVDKVKYLLEIQSENDIDLGKIHMMESQSVDDLKYNPDVEPETDHVG